jgi:hypothetical protein
MGPFTNYLPQRNLVTMTIVSIFHKIRKSDWLGAIVDVSIFLSLPSPSLLQITTSNYRSRFPLDAEMAKFRTTSY